MSSKRRVKRTVPKSCTATTATTQIKILRLIKMGEHYPSDLKESLNISKQTLNYHLMNLKEKGLIEPYSKGIYDITNSGKKILATYETNENKKYIQLENMRYKVAVCSGFDEIMERIRNIEETKLNNGVIQYTGKIGQLSVRAFCSNQNNSIEITCPKWVGENIYEIMYNAKRQIDVIVHGFTKIKGVKLGLLEQSMKPEWAVPHPFAEIILKTTQSSQIITSNGVINRSAGRNADWETDDIVQATRIMNMPNDIEDIKNTLHDIKDSISIYRTSNLEIDYPMYG